MCRLIFENYHRLRLGEELLIPLQLHTAKPSSPGPGAGAPVPVSGSFLVRALGAPPVSGIGAAPGPAAAAPATGQVRQTVWVSTHSRSQLPDFTCILNASRNSSSWIWTWSGTVCVFYCLCLDTKGKKNKTKSSILSETKSPMRTPKS